MDPSQLAAASDLLYELWLSGRRIPELPPRLRPSTRAQGYAIQSLIEHRSASRLFGWKIAATSVPGQRHIRVDAPLAGRILSERVIANGGRCSLRGNLMRVAELEFAFRLRTDIVPRAQPYTLDEVMEHVGALHPAIEVPDSRFEPFEAAGAAQLIADNACAHDFLLGEASPEVWRSMNLATYQVAGSLDGASIRGSGANVLGDPRIALTWLANELSQHGATVRAGEVVTTGTCVVPIQVNEGNRLWGDFGVLGAVSVSFVD
jgi:2-keto-4-pentenoate hydratase